MQLTVAGARGKDTQGFIVHIAFWGSVGYSSRQHRYLTNPVAKYFDNRQHHIPVVCSSVELFFVRKLKKI